ncbi:hypothetical protein HZB60_09285 [candidate division KSB1 bacterium]|nr:hypothetical protein [candidate division KSB1 bacterium]
MNSVWWAIVAVLFFGMTAWADDPLQLTIYATGNGDSLVLRWVEIADATEYWVYAGERADDDYLVIGGGGERMYADEDKGHSSRFYRVEALKYDGTYVLLARSDTVGYFTFDMPMSGYYSFGLPGFEFLDLTEANEPIWCTRSFRPSDILDEQPACGNLVTADRVIRQGGGFSYRSEYSNCVWAGSLETPPVMRGSCAYWYQAWWQFPPRLVLAGVMHPCSALVVDSSVVNPNSYTPYSWATVRNLPREQVGATLLDAGFLGGTISTSDKVIEQGAGYMYYNTEAGAWRGSLTEIKPVKAYWIQSKHVTGFTYRWRPE